MRWIILTIALSIIGFGSAWGKDSALPEGIMAVDGRPAPELRLSDMDGQAFDLEDSKGHWRFVHFWASWCGPCRREIPSLARMATMMETTRLRIVLVNTAETEDAVFSFLGSVAPDLTTLMDYDGLVTERWQPRGLPATFLVDPLGNIQYMALGGRPWDQAEYISFLRGLATKRD